MSNTSRQSLCGNTERLVIRLLEEEFGFNDCLITDEESDFEGKDIAFTHGGKTHTVASRVRAPGRPVDPKVDFTLRYKRRRAGSLYYLSEYYKLRDSGGPNGGDYPSLYVYAVCNHSRPLAATALRDYIIINLRCLAQMLYEDEMHLVGAGVIAPHEYQNASEGGKASSFVSINTVAAIDYYRINFASRPDTKRNRKHLLWATNIPSLCEHAQRGCLRPYNKGQHVTKGADNGSS